MIPGLEKLLFTQMWLTPHHFKLALLIMLIVLFWGFWAQMCNPRLLGRGVEGALEASQVPLEFTSRKRPS